MKKAEQFGYISYFFGQNVIWMLMFSFQLPFLTDLEIEPSAVAAIVLAIGIFATVLDPLVGGIIDRVRFKSGKFLPWIRMGLFAIPVANVIFFSVSGSLASGVKIAMVLGFGVVWYVAYALSDVALNSVITVMTKDTDKRTSLMSLSRAFGMISTITVMVAVPLLLGQMGWFRIGVMLSIVAFAAMILFSVSGRERVAFVAEKKLALGEMLQAIIHNKFIIILYSAMIISQVCMIINALSMHFARFILGGEEYLAMLNGIAIVPTIALGMCMPVLLKKVDKFVFFYALTAANVVLSVAMYFIGYGSFPLLVVMFVLRGTVAALQMILVSMFGPDLLEYGNYKQGIRATGVVFSVQTFTSKMTAAIATSFAAALLGVIGFVSGEGAMQPAGFEDRFWMIFILIPAAGSFISALILPFYKLRDKHVQVMTLCNAGEITREQARSDLQGMGAKYL